MASWMHQEENGLQQSKQIGDLKVQANYIPPAYYALRENPADFQHLMKEYEQSLSFMISISWDRGENILWRGLTNYEAYKERIHELNFNLENYLILYVGEQKVHPVLTNVENLYEETDHLRINMVFPKEALGDFSAEDELTLELDDRIFKTGMNVFRFATQKIENIPTPILTS
jgi:hypothetical protein